MIKKKKKASALQMTEVFPKFKWWKLYLIQQLKKTVCYVRHNKNNDTDKKSL